MRKAMKKNISTIMGVTYTLIGSAIFGIIPALSLNAYKGGISVLTLISLKYLIASTVLLVYCGIRYHWYRLPKFMMLKIILNSGVLYATQSVLYAYAVTIMPVSFAALLLFTYPVFVSIISALCKIEKLSLLGFTILIVAFAGIVLMFADAEMKISGIGIFLVILASLSYAVYIVIMSRLSKNLPPVVTNMFANIGPAISLTIITIITGSFSLAFTPVTWYYIVFNALGSGLLAYWLWFKGLKHLGAVKTTAISMTEPIFAVLASFILLRQAMTIIQITGGIVLLVGVTLFMLVQRKTHDNINAQIL
jgi:drug/metabolite transporter (DMT)-like permease